MYPDANELAQIWFALFCIMLGGMALGIVVAHFLWGLYRKYSTWKKREGRANGYIKPKWHTTGEK